MPKINEQHWVYIHNPVTYPDWTKIGRTKNILNRIDDYNITTPLKEHTIEKVLACSSLEDAHYIEQAVKTILSEVFEASGEWVKCSAEIVRREILQQYFIATNPEYNDLCNTKEFTTSLREKSIKEKNLIADQKIKFWEAVKRYNNLEIKNKGKLGKSIVQFLQELPANIDVKILEEKGHTKIALNLLENFDKESFASCIGREAFDEALQNAVFFDRIDIFDHKKYHLFFIDHPNFPPELRNRYNYNRDQELVARFIQDLPAYKYHWRIFKDGPTQKLAIGPRIYEIWSKKIDSKSDYQMIKKGLRQLPYFLEANIVNRIHGTVDRCTILRLEGENAFPADVLERMIKAENEQD